MDRTTNAQGATRNSVEDEQPVACTLEGGEQIARRDRWLRLGEFALVDETTTEHGVELRFPGWKLGVQLLLASRALFDELHRRLAAAGHDHLRPAHGFLFQALGPNGATASEVAPCLGVTKQAARLVVEELTGLGYVERGEDPDDGGSGNLDLKPNVDPFAGVQEADRHAPLLRERLYLLAPLPQPGPGS